MFLTIRTKVDLTKYVEEHIFTFDQAFGERATNMDVININ